VVLGRGAVSYERGTPVRVKNLILSMVRKVFLTNLNQHGHHAFPDVKVSNLRDRARQGGTIVEKLILWTGLGALAQLYSG